MTVKLANYITQSTGPLIWLTPETEVMRENERRVENV
jgi:hypothetical protein